MRGFTYIEIIIVISIAGILAAASYPLFSYFQTAAILESAKYEVLQNIRLAQTKARSGENMSAFGIYFSGASHTLYQGNSYSQRAQSQDVVFILPANMEFSNLSEINFSFKTGLPSVIGTLVITNTISNRTERININQAGLIY